MHNGRVLKSRFSSQLQFLINVVFSASPPALQNPAYLILCNAGVADGIKSAPVSLQPADFSENLISCVTEQKKNCSPATPTIRFPRNLHRMRDRGEENCSSATPTVRSPRNLHRMRDRTEENCSPATPAVRSHRNFGISISYIINMFFSPRKNFLRVFQGIFRIFFLQKHLVRITYIHTISI